MRILGCMALVIAAVIARPASAWLIYPEDEAPGRWTVEIENPAGDVVALDALPPPFASVLGIGRASAPLSFRWRYERNAEGLARITIAADGQGVMRFDFLARTAVEGRRYGAAAVLIDGDGAALHTFYALALDSPDFAEPGDRHAVELALDRPAEWWRGVRSIAFLYMTYHPHRPLGDADIRRAMRRAVGRITNGEGSEQQG